MERKYGGFSSLLRVAKPYRLLTGNRLKFPYINPFKKVQRNLLQVEVQYLQHDGY